MVVFDATFLVALLNDKTRNSIPDGHARVEYLVQELDKAREVIVVPTPALSEVLVGAKAAAPAYQQILKGSAYFRIVPFDDLAAVEAAAQTAAAMAAGDKMIMAEVPHAHISARNH